MSSVSGAAGHAALAICESMLVSLTENKIIDGAEGQARRFSPTRRPPIATRYRWWPTAARRPTRKPLR